jgi:maltooligosyltrehalose trehalohydrolase
LASKGNVVLGSDPTASSGQGAFVLSDKKGVEFRVWAPERETVEVVLDGKRMLPLTKDAWGYLTAIVPDIEAGQRYRYRLDGREELADPASRYQPEGVEGPSEVVDVSSFEWTDSEWTGRSLAGQVLYEMHVGTFTREGTFLAAAKHLRHLKELGVTVIEMMPVAAFPGRFGWGYDGVFPFAVYEQYGRPEELAGFINTAHEAGIAVILDVVYNHIGPKGNVLPLYSPYYFSKTEKTDWGPAINYDGEHCGPVREYVRDNAVHWVRDFHCDGFRIDATQDIYDRSDRHIIVDLVEAAHAAAPNRALIVIGENEPQQSYYVRPISAGGYGLDGLWNDDFHHSAIVALTGQSDAYYSDYKGQPQEFVSAFKYGYLYQGQWYMWQQQNRGVPGLDVPRNAFVHFIQNHDQIANSASGARVHELSSPGKLRAITALLLLGPATPMLFQGQEYASPTPFLFFADYEGELAEAVRKGRRDFLKQWQSMCFPALDPYLADPCNVETLERCKLDFNDKKKRRAWYDLHADLLKLRREDSVFATQAKWGLDGAVLGRDSFVIRFFSQNHESDRLLLVNLGVEDVLSPVPEPLLAPPEQKDWSIMWSSEHPKYGGNGIGPLITDKGWLLPGCSTLVLGPIAKRTQGRVNKQSKE